jgi:hypothetical protein
VISTLEHHSPQPGAEEIAAEVEGDDQSILMTGELMLVTLPSRSVRLTD